MKDVWSTVHNTESYVTNGLTPGNRNERHTCMSQSFETVMLTKR